jgi:hypothetical protein
MVIVIHFFVGSIEVLVPVIASTQLHNGPDAGVFPCGIRVGNDHYGHYAERENYIRPGKEALFSAVFCMGTLFVVGSFFKWNSSIQIYALLGMLFLFGYTIICAGIAFKTLLQKNVDNRFGGRIFAVAGSVGNAAIPVP